MTKGIIILQAIRRGVIFRSNYIKLQQYLIYELNNNIDEIIVIQSVIRGYQSRIKYNTMKKYNNMDEENIFEQRQLNNINFLLQSCKIIS